MESTGAPATDAGLLICTFRRNTSAPPARQAPTTHRVQLVSPSQTSGRETTWSASFEGILAGAAGGGGGGGGEGEMVPWLLEKSFFLLCLSGGSAGTPGCHFFFILNFLRNSFHWGQASWAQSQRGLPPPTQVFSLARFGETRAPRPQDRPQRPTESS